MSETLECGHPASCLIGEVGDQDCGWCLDRNRSEHRAGRLQEFAMRAARQFHFLMYTPTADLDKIVVIIDAPECGCMYQKVLSVRDLEALGSTQAVARAVFDAVEGCRDGVARAAR